MSAQVLNSSWELDYRIPHEVQSLIALLLAGELLLKESVTLFSYCLGQTFAQLLGVRYCHNLVSIKFESF